MTIPKVEIRIEKLALRLRGVTPAAAGGQVSVLDAGRVGPLRPGDGGSLSRSVGDAVARAIGAQLANPGPKGEGS